MKKKYIWSLLCGALLPLCFAPFDDYFFLVGGLIFPLIAVYFWQIIHSQNIRQAFLFSWSFGFAFFLTGISWVYVAIHVFGHTPWWLAVFLTLIFVAVLALFYGLQGALSFYLLKRWFNRPSLPYSFIIFVLPINWLLFEWLRSWVLSGFPWLLVGYSQLSTPLQGYAPIVGVYGLSLIVASLSAALLLLNKNKIRISVVFIGVIISGIYLDTVEWTKPQGEALKVTIIQGNSPQLSRWEQNYLNRIMRRYENLSLQWWDKSDLLIWPENAIPVFYHRVKDTFYQRIQNKIDRYDTTFISGLPVQDQETGQYYNALLKQEKDNQQFYFKQHLVPFGEFLPLASYLKGLINFFNIPMSGFSTPKQAQEVIRIKGLPIATSICYEDIFPKLALQNLPNARLLLNLSNNGWYGTSLAPHQHLQIARMRALESGRELIRSTTSGISALIDHKGHVRARTPQFKKAILTGKVQPRIGYTPYVRYTNSILIIYLIFAYLFLHITIRKKTKFHS